MAARCLHMSGAEVWAWDDDAGRRATAAAEDVPLVDLSDCDWRIPVSLVLEHHLPHGEPAHPIVARARAAGCEVISDAELLARAQRDAAYLGLACRHDAARALDLIGHVVRLSVGESEIGGDAERPMLGLHPLDAGGNYVLSMPPGRADLTLSITFDVAVLLELGDDPWPPADSLAATDAAAAWLFHRQTGPKAAVVNADDSRCRPLLDELAQRAEQILIPVSGRRAAPGGVYVEDGVLYDDLGGKADPVTELATSGDPDRARDGLFSAAAYATAISLGAQPHAVMASIKSFFLD